MENHYWNTIVRTAIDKINTGMLILMDKNLKRSRIRGSLKESPPKRLWKRGRHYRTHVSRIMSPVVRRTDLTYLWWDAPRRYIASSVFFLKIHKRSLCVRKHQAKSSCWICYTIPDQFSWKMSRSQKTKKTEELSQIGGDWRHTGRSVGLDTGTKKKDISQKKLVKF